MTSKELEIITYIYDGEDEENEIQSVCAEFLKGKISEPMLPSTGQNLEGEMLAAITVPYLRALAKIAFHFVLAHFEFSGLEPQFNDIKRFIFTGRQPRTIRAGDTLILPRVIARTTRNGATSGRTRGTELKSTGEDTRGTLLRSRTCSIHCRRCKTRGRLCGVTSHKAGIGFVGRKCRGFSLGQARDLKQQIWRGRSREVL